MQSKTHGLETILNIIMLLIVIMNIFCSSMNTTGDLLNFNMRGCPPRFPRRYEVYYQLQCIILNMHFTSVCFLLLLYCVLEWTIAVNFMKLTIDQWDNGTCSFTERKYFSATDIFMHIKQATTTCHQCAKSNNKAGSADGD